MTRGVYVNHVLGLSIVTGGLKELIGGMTGTAEGVGRVRGKWKLACESEVTMGREAQSAPGFCSRWVMPRQGSQGADEHFVLGFVQHFSSLNASFRSPPIVAHCFDFVVSLSAILSGDYAPTGPLERGRPPEGESRLAEGVAVQGKRVPRVVLIEQCGTRCHCLMLVRGF